MWGDALYLALYELLKKRFKAKFRVFRRFYQIGQPATVLTFTANFDSDVAAAISRRSVDKYNCRNKKMAQSSHT